MRTFPRFWSIEMFTLLDKTFSSFIMHLLEVFLALTSFSSCTYALQLPLHKYEHSISTSSFIQSSIFGRHRIYGAQVLIQDPVPPRYQLRDLYDDLPHSGIDTFAHLNWMNYFAPQSDGTFDITIIWAHFDLGVSYRPGARFGPTSVRMGARRINPSWGWESVRSTHYLNIFDLRIVWIME